MVTWGTCQILVDFTRNDPVALKDERYCHELTCLKWVVFHIYCSIVNFVTCATSDVMCYQWQQVMSYLVASTVPVTKHSLYLVQHTF